MSVCMCEGNSFMLHLSLSPVEARYTLVALKIVSRTDRAPCFSSYDDLSRYGAGQCQIAFSSILPSCMFAIVHIRNTGVVPI
jgi:hypothetical protein